MKDRKLRTSVAGVVLAAVFLGSGVPEVALAQDASAPPDVSLSAHASTWPEPSLAAIEQLLAGVAGDGDAALASAPLTLTVEAGDVFFEPKELSIASDEPTRLVLESSGQVAHNLIVDELGLQLHVGPGDSSEITVSDLPPGTYQFYCAIYGHRRAGMYGTLTVE